MSKRIDFSNLGGNPVDQDALNFMQDSYKNPLAGLAALCGEKVIVTGVQIVGASITSGWIVYGGELIPFVGGFGGMASAIIIEEVAASVTFQDNAVRNIYFTKTARPGLPGTFPYSDLRRLNTLQELRWLTGDLKQVDCTPDYVIANFDATGLGKNDRKGWAVCNGQNGTKNRGGRVSVGMNYPAINIDPGDNVWDAIYNTVGLTAGEKRHTLSALEIPALTGDTLTENQGTDGSANGKTVYNGDGEGNGSGWKVGTVRVNTGGGGSHENRQPFIVTLFIQKL